MDDKIHETEKPIEAHISKGEIEFKNVSFSYDKKENSDSNKNIINLYRNVADIEVVKGGIDS